MFDNIGKKIKTLAEIIAFAGMIITVFLGLCYIVSYIDLEAYEQKQNTNLIISGLVLLIVGPIASWIGGFFTYGFGELIDKTCDIHKMLGGTNKKGNFDKSDFLG